MWNMVWGNMFYRYQFLKMNNRYLSIWTSVMIGHSFLSAFIYLAILFCFVKYAKERNESKVNTLTLINLIWNCLTVFITILLILTSINEYYLSDKFSTHAQLSDTVQIMLFF